jgi:hypothetical protein
MISTAVAAGVHHVLTFAEHARLLDHLDGLFALSDEMK